MSAECMALAVVRPPGKRNGNYKHGGRTKEAITSMREVNELLRQIRKLP
jgi:hypothetical protein